MAPESVICHICLASALARSFDLEGAIKEYKIALRLDPTDYHPHKGLGFVYESQGDDAAALKKYQEASKLEPDSATAHRRVAYMLLRLKENKNALREAEAAAELDPGNWQVHGVYAQALAANGENQKATGEFKEALLLDADDIGTHLDFAAFLERQGDWVGAMEQYNQAKKCQLAALTKPSPQAIRDADGTAAGAELRSKQHLSELRAAGKSAEAADLESKCWQVRLHRREFPANSTPRLRRPQLR